MTQFSESPYVNQWRRNQTKKSTGTGLAAAQTRLFKTATALQDMRLKRNPFEVSYANSLAIFDRRVSFL
jgi:hypothetical protein